MPFLGELGNWYNNVIPFEFQRETNKQMSYSTVYRWFTSFCSGHEYIGQWATFAFTECNTNKIKSNNEGDAYFTVRLACVHIIRKKRNISRFRPARVLFFFKIKETFSEMQFIPLPNNMLELKIKNNLISHLV